MNTQFQNALKCLPQNVPPIWMMRQAGRYHKHYQALRAKHSFMELCKNPELASEVALNLLKILILMYQFYLVIYYFHSKPLVWDLSIKRRDQSLDFISLQKILKL